MFFTMSLRNMFSGVVLVLLTNSLVAAESPPSEYHLDQFSLTLKHWKFGYTTEYWDSIHIGGDGEGNYTETDRDTNRSFSFALSEERARKLVRDLYEIHFFELRDNYTSKPIVEFDENGRVQTMVSSTNHTWNTTVIVTIGSYEKTVRYDSHGVPPEGLERLVGELEDLLKEYIPDGGSNW